LNEKAYLDNLQSSIERLLTNIDRNRDSETFGCFARPFWHDKVTDFPSAHQQIGVLPLAIVYGNKLEQNPFYKDENIREICNAGIEYWKKIQRSNGSFDEHYPREHSLGATAWSLWAITEAVEHLGNTPDIENSVRKSVDFIASRDEPGTIANHQAVTAAALFNSSKVVEVKPEIIKSRINRVQELQSSEGWFQEYKGGDPGYQSTAIAHLSRIWKEKPEWVDSEMLEKSVDFFGSFIDNENYYGSGIGARRTQHVHPTGFEILADEFENASEVAYYLRKHTLENKILNPTAVDDKHFSWHQAEFLDSYLSASSLEEKEKEIENQRFKDFLIKKTEDKKAFVNLSKGGYFKYYRNGNLLKEDQGITTEINGKKFTSNWMGTTESIKENKNKVEISGNLRSIPSNTLNWHKYMLLRWFQHTLGRIPKISLFAKNRLINQLITGDNSKYRFKRIINIENGQISYSVNGETIEGKTRSMFIPNSEYFER